MIPSKTMKDSFISDLSLQKSHDTIKSSQQLTLSLSFKIQGAVREAFCQKNWERAYNKHDNSFRMTIEVNLKSGRKTLRQLRLVRKAALFWTRNPKIPYRIWVSIVKDDEPFYPLTEDEAKSLLFDINKVIELNGSDLDSGTHKLYTDISVSWGKHEYTEPAEIKAKSNEILLIRMAAGTSHEDLSTHP